MQINTLIAEITQEASREYMGEPVLGHFMRLEGEWGEVSKVDESSQTELYISNIHRLGLVAPDNVTSMLNSVNEFCKSIVAGDTEMVGKRHSEYETEWEKLVDMNGLLGAREQFLDSLIEHNDFLDVNYQSELSRIEDLDLAQASIELSTAETSYTLAIEVSNRLQEILDPIKFLS